MARFGDYNNVHANIDWGIDTKNYPFKKCSEMPLGEELQVHGFFITPDQGFGKGAVMILDEVLLNIPGRYVEDIEKMLSDPEVIDDIQSGKGYIIISKWKSKKYNRDSYDVKMISK